jgi:hypothetical protein
VLHLGMLPNCRRGRRSEVSWSVFRQGFRGLESHASKALAMSVRLSHYWRVCCRFLSATGHPFLTLNGSPHLREQNGRPRTLRLTSPALAFLPCPGLVGGGGCFCRRLSRRGHCWSSRTSAYGNGWGAAAQEPAAAFAQCGPAVLDLRQSMVRRLDREGQASVGL